MKKNTLLLGLMLATIISSLGFSACSPDYETNFDVKTLYIKHIDLASIKFNVDGGSKEIPVETNVLFDNWTATSNAEWCVVEKGTDKVKVSATNSDLYMTRTARVTIAYGHQSYEIIVTQNGTQPVILIDGEREGVEKEVDANGGEFSVIVETNLELDYVSIPETATWLKLKGISGTGKEKVMTFDVLASFIDNVREAVVTLQSASNHNYTSSFKIKQSERAWVWTPIELTLDMLSSNAVEPSEGSIANLLDDNIGTYFHTLYSKASPGGKPHYLQIDLDEPVKLFSIEYTGRGGGGMGGDVKRAGIWVSETGNDIDSEWTKAAVVTYDLSIPKDQHYKINEGVIMLEKEYKHIRFIPEARRNADPIDPSGTQGFWYASGIFLYSTLL